MTSPPPLLPHEQAVVDRAVGVANERRHVVEVFGGQADHTPLIVNAATGVVHLATCRNARATAYAAPWSPDERDPLDQAHHCLPDGLPDGA